MARLTLIPGLLAITFAACQAQAAPKDNGTYRSVSVSSPEDCYQMCQNDRINCVGTLMESWSHRPGYLVCHLNNGLGTDSPFEPRVPEPFVSSPNKSDDKPYKTLNVDKSEDCNALCNQEYPACEFSRVENNPQDASYNRCSLFSKFDENSKYFTKIPESLNILEAERDFNEYRARYGLTPVSLNSRLTYASQLHSDDQAYIGDASHSGSDGSQSGQRALNQGYKYILLAENVAAGQYSWDVVFESWKNSPGHNENLLSPEVSDFGLAMTYDQDSPFKVYWTMMLGAPAPEGVELIYSK